MSRRETLQRLRAILKELYVAQYEGAPSQRFYRAQGVADGYMRALADLRVFDDSVLLDLVHQERRRALRRADKAAPEGSRIQPAVEFA